MARVRRSPARIEATFLEALARAKARGELSPDADVTAPARFLTSSFQALRLVGKATPDRAVPSDIAFVMLRYLGK